MTTVIARTTPRTADRDAKAEKPVIVAGPTVVSREGTVAKHAWAIGPISIGFTFLWAFFDRTFAFGYATGTDGETGVIDRFREAAGSTAAHR